MLIILTRDIENIGLMGQEVDVPEHIARAWIEEGRAAQPLPELPKTEKKEEAPEPTPLPAIRKRRW